MQIFKRSTIALIIAATVCAPIFANATDASRSHSGTNAQQSLAYPPTGLQDHGARLGIVFEQTAYTYQGINVVKVLTVDPASNLAGIVVPGDFIYGINGYNFRTSADMFSVVSSGTPGTEEVVYFLDSRHNYQAMNVAVATISESQMGHQAGADSVAAIQTADTSLGDKSFCEDHPVFCGLAAVAAVAVVGKALSGSDSESDSDSSHNSADWDRYQQQQNRELNDSIERRNRLRNEGKDYW